MAEENRYAVATGDWTDTATWSTSSGGSGGASVPDTDQHAIIESGVNVTINANDEIKSLTVNSGGTLTGNSSYSLTLNDEGDSTYGTAGYALKVVGALGTNVNIILTTQATTIILVSTSGAGGSLHNLTINHASCDAVQFSHITLAGNLTITAGALSTGSDKNLTVTGDLVIGAGTLTGNDSTINVGSYNLGNASGVTTIGTSGVLQVNKRDSGGWTFRIDAGTFTNNGELIMAFDGTNTSGSSTSQAYMKNATGSNHGKMTVNCTDSSDTIYIGRYSADPWLAGDITVTSGILSSDDPSGSITDTNTSFASLTIESNGEYAAPVGGTTTITKGSSTAGHSGQPSAIEVKSGGTFTHNKGTVLLSSAYDQDLEFDGTGNMYNLTINKSDNDVIHNSNLTIEGNLDITMGGVHSFRPNTGSRTVTVYGNTYLTGAGGARVGGVTQYTGTNSWGLVTINSGEFILSTGTNNVTGIRNIGGTVSQS